MAIVQSAIEKRAADHHSAIGNSLLSSIATSNFVRGQQHEPQETRRKETNGVEAQVGIAEVEEDGTFRPEQVCRGTEDDARK
ncbi:MAG: hypothetical protein ABW292_20400 [Vicinamibacterales bacterium]